jgi:hypothetical protein
VFAKWFYVRDIRLGPLGLSLEPFGIEFVSWAKIVSLLFHLWALNSLCNL